MTNELDYLGEPKYQPKLGVDSQKRRLFPYLPHPDLVKAVNLAITLGRPLLLQGDPGCGKTLLARAIAYEFGQRYLNKKDEWPYFRWNITSRTQAQQGRYIYDSLGRLRDAQMIGSENLKNFMNKEEQKRLLDRLNNPESYITWGELGNTYREANYRPILLLDEIDKADIDFPNDLLADLEDSEDSSFTIIETQQKVRATHKPIVIITSNNERELPEAFLRRCLFYYLEFPVEERLKEIIKLHFPEEKLANLRTKAVDTFLDVRMKGPGRTGSKKSSTSELIDWLRYLTKLPLEEAEGEIDKLAKDPAQLGILLKSKVDIDRLLLSKPL
jgi:MoxR-like ATPase